MNSDTFLSLHTVAARTDTSVAFWRKALARRLLPATRIGRAVRIRESDLTRFLAARERPTVASR